MNFLNSLASELNRTIDDCIKFGKNNIAVIGCIVIGIYLFRDYRKFSVSLLLFVLVKVCVYLLPCKY